ncbi:MAG: hypothetical protein KGV44_00250 [Flavobacteriaceae bacterium]|nr:hypothetical protein [Flavobacteriaceae bacterium]
MSCTNCSSNINNTQPRGCKNNGHCSSGGCDKLGVFDWLGNMALPTGQERFSIVEVRFKNGRKHFYRNEDKLPISMGDIVAVESNPGHDIGVVTLTGELVKLQMSKKGVRLNDELPKVYRKATQRDIDIWETSRAKEAETQSKSREIVSQLGLKMKLSDVEYQGDGNKATFYYTADERVDFRQLIRDLAGMLNIRIEMKQVGLRQEAARLGGVGSCGRELCCSTWLTDFRNVSTFAARYQQLSLNPQKLAGQCGKLKCCLNFELDTYLDALKSFPKHDVVLKTEKGEANFIKMDIFKEVLWYAYKEERTKWYKLSLEQVQEIIELNKKGQLISSLEDVEEDEEETTKMELFENVVGQDSLTRFDKAKSKRKRKKRKKKAVVATKDDNQQTQQKPNKETATKNKQNANRQGNNNKRRNKRNNRNQNKKPNKDA